MIDTNQKNKQTRSQRNLSFQFGKNPGNTGETQSRISTKNRKGRNPDKQDVKKESKYIKL